jgi:hygromycin-B 7''-O-kinase
MTNGGRDLFKTGLAVPIATAQAIVDRAQPGRTVSAISRLHGGEIGAVYEVALGETQAPLVLKVYPDALHWKMQKEATVVALVQDRVGVPVPRILLADDSKSLLAFSFIVMSKLEGEARGRLEPALAAEQVSSAYAQMGKVLREFHQIPMEAFGYIGPQGIWTAHASNRAFMSFQFDKKLKEFIDRGGASDIARLVGDFASARTYLLEGCAVPVFCHYDFHPGNVLATTTGGGLRLSGILDFENAIASDPLMDIAKTLYYAANESGIKRSSLLDGYGPIERRDWAETIVLYRLYYALELWCWFAQIGNVERLAGLAQDLERYATE